MEWSALLSPVPQGILELSAGPLGAWAAAVLLACLALLALVFVASGARTAEPSAAAHTQRSDSENPALRVIAGGRERQRNAA